MHDLLCINSVCTCCLCNVMYKMVQIVLCEYCICSNGYRCWYVHEGYAKLCGYGVVHVLDMQSCVQMMLCRCWICSDMYIWYSMHVVHMLLCTYGVVCMIVQGVL